ncbi:MAG TPA: hypothetical protein VIK04_00685 [Solirubrobacteraceae bacterium]
MLGLTLAAAVVALAFLTSGNSDPSVLLSGGYAWSEIALLVLGAGACAVVPLIGARGRAWGAVTIGWFAAFTAFAALSILWSIVPDWSWYGANQLLAYLAVFAGAAAVARVFPERWTVVIGGLAVGMTALAAYSLLAKVFPATLSSANAVGRLVAPFGYWNAIGVTAALGVPACLWAGARRSGGVVLRAVTVPALTVLISVVILSYSRSALLVAAVSAAIWIAWAPVRLRSALMLGLGGVGAIPIVVWALDHHALSGDAIAAVAQDSAGHTFGLVLIVVLVLTTAVGLAGSVGMDRVAVSAGRRHRIGTVLVGLVALIPIGLVIGLAGSSRGLFGEISHVWTTLTSSTYVGDTSSRLTQFGSSRPLYWHQGLDVGSHALLKGVGELGYGIARLRYTVVPAKTDQAHSFAVQTFADLGLIGVAIMVALLATWGRACARALAPRARWASLSPQRSAEREGLLVLAAIAVGFGIQSALDWTWYFAGVTVPALIAAGWLAGRGPLATPIGRRVDPTRLRDRPGAGALITGLAAAALIGAWAMWEPLHSAQAYAAAGGASTNAAAFADARTAACSNPLSIAPLELLATLDEGIDDSAAARDELIQATRLQPENPEPWFELGTFYAQHGQYPLTLQTLSHVVDLDHVQVDNLTGPAHAIAKQTQETTAAEQAAARARTNRRSRARRQPASRATAPGGGRRRRR